jgi:hypothetical protein
MKIKCKNCENEFEKSGKKVFCSEICVKDNKNKKRRKKSEQVMCKICDNFFTQKRKDNLTCSGSCSQKLWILKNPDKNWNRQNSIEAKKRKNEWRKKNIDKIRIIKQRYKKKRRQNDISYNLYEKMSNAIRIALNGKGFKKWTKIVGYDAYDLKNHLEKTLPENISWNEFLKNDYHIDHIIPQSLYSYKNEFDEDFKKCWELKNLRILPGKENKQKSDILDFDLVKKYDISHLLPKNILNNSSYKDDTKQEG